MNGLPRPVATSGEWGPRCRVQVVAAVKASTKDAGGVAPDYPLTAPLGPQLMERFPSHLNLCQLDPLCKGGVHDPGVGIGGLPGARSQSRLDGPLHPQVDRS